MTSVGQLTRSHVSRRLSLRDMPSARVVSASVSGVVASAHATQSSICLLE